MPKTIELTQGFQAIVDDEDAEYVSQYNWYTCTNVRNNMKYAARKIQRNYIERTVFLHQVIVERMRVIVPGKFIIEHEDGDGLNNRNFDRRLRINNKSGIAGIGYSVAHNKWYSRITHNKRRINLGFFNTKERAIIARKEAEKKYFGETKS